MAKTIKLNVELDETNAKILAAIAERRGMQLGEIVETALVEFRDAALRLVKVPMAH